MTLQIDGFIVTGTPDEVNTFDTDIKKWEITCKDSSNINGSVVKPE